MLRLQQDAAYRYFFPFSIAGAILGLGQFLFRYDGAGIIWHREIMITLFLLPAAAGFLYTASPRFLKSKPAGRIETMAVMLAFILLFVAYFTNNIAAFHLAKLITILLLFAFFMFRWWNRGADNPYWPPFIIISLVTGIFAASIHFCGTFIQVTGAWPLLADHLYYDAMFWILLFGIGLKFFPMLTGAVAPVYRKGRFSLISKDRYEGQAVWFLIALLALLSFILQDFLPPAFGLLLRALLILFMSYQGWALFEAPQRKGYTTSFLRICLGIIVVAHFVFILYPAPLVHMYHIVFVAGFLSLTLAVETRVVLSHEHLDLAYEQASRWQLSAFILLLLAMAARVVAGLIPEHYPMLLQIASALALAGVMIMVWKIGGMLARAKRS